MTALLQRRLNLDFAEAKEPARMICVEQARSDLRLNEDEVVYLIEDGRIGPAFDFAMPGSRRRKLRIWRGALERKNADLKEVILDILPRHNAAALTVQELASSWVCSRTLICKLLDLGELVESGVQCGITGVRRATRASVVEFMKRRLA